MIGAEVPTTPALYRPRTITVGAPNRYKTIVSQLRGHHNAAPISPPRRATTIGQGRRAVPIPFPTVNPPLEGQGGPIRAPGGSAMAQRRLPPAAGEGIVGPPPHPIRPHLKSIRADPVRASGLWSPHGPNHVG